MPLLSGTALNSGNRTASSSRTKVGHRPSAATRSRPSCSRVSPRMMSTTGMKGKPDDVRRHRPTTNGTSAAAAASAPRRDLPMPASPVTNAPGDAEPVAAIAPSTARSSACLPASGGAAITDQAQQTVQAASTQLRTAVGRGQASRSIRPPAGGGLIQPPLIVASRSIRGCPAVARLTILIVWDAAPGSRIWYVILPFTGEAA